MCWLMEILPSEIWLAQFSRLKKTWFDVSQSRRVTVFSSLQMGGPMRLSSSEATKPGAAFVSSKGGGDFPEGKDPLAVCIIPLRLSLGFEILNWNYANSLFVFSKLL